jgi:hypothetical protein
MVAGKLDLTHLFVPAQTPRSEGALGGSGRRTVGKEATEWLPDTIKWYEKIDLPVGYVGLVHRMRAKDNDCQST